MGWYGGWKPYVPVAQRRANAAKYAAQLAKREKRTLAPIEIAGRTIAASFWGRAWCENLECYSDFANRLPRGRTYVRNGSVIDLQIKRGTIQALVSGSEVYKVKIDIQTLAPAVWKRVKDDCARSIGSLIDLLAGRFDQGIMQRLARRDGGLFPQPKEISLRCSCPDWAGMCKHVAAVLYGVGARLDSAPEMLFTLRGVDHLELIGDATSAGNLDQALAGDQTASLAGSDLGELFGIDIDIDAQTGAPAPPSRKGRRRRIDQPPQSAAEVAPQATPARRPRKASKASKAKASPVKVLPLKAGAPKAKPSSKRSTTRAAAATRRSRKAK